MTLPLLSLWKLLALRLIASPPGLIQVGTFLATSHCEEIKSMTDMHFPASKGTIMVVDDNQDFLDIVKIILETSG